MTSQCRQHALVGPRLAHDEVVCKHDADPRGRLRRGSASLHQIDLNLVWQTLSIEITSTLEAEPPNRASGAVAARTLLSGPAAGGVYASTALGTPGVVTLSAWLVTRSHGAAPGTTHTPNEGPMRTSSAAGRGALGCAYR